MTKPEVAMEATSTYSYMHQTHMCRKVGLSISLVSQATMVDKKGRNCRDTTDRLGLSSSTSSSNAKVKSIFPKINSFLVSAFSIHPSEVRPLDTAISVQSVGASGIFTPLTPFEQPKSSADRFENLNTFLYSYSNFMIFEYFSVFIF